MWALLVRWGRKTLSTVGVAMSQLLGLSRRGRGLPRLLVNFHDRLSREEGPGVALRLDYEWIPLAECSRPGAGFALGELRSARLPLGLSTTGPHSFQGLPPALRVRWGWEALSTASGGAWAKRIRTRQICTLPTSAVRAHP